MTDVLRGEALAKELARGLAGTRVLSLAAIEPDLDPLVHTSPPHVILSDRHTIAIVQGLQVMIDGPQQSDNNHRFPSTPVEREATRAEIARVTAAWGVPAAAEDGGVADTALSIMRFLKQRGMWYVRLANQQRGLQAHIFARNGTRSWPGGLHVHHVEGGAMRMTCGESTRELHSLAELADFATREGPILDAGVIWCGKFVASLARIAPVATALVEVVRATHPARVWRTYSPEAHFGLDTRCAFDLIDDHAEASAGVIELDGDGFRVTIADYTGTFGDAAALRARSDEIRDAVARWVASPAAEPPVRDHTYYR